jgi:hypothetical protein
MRSRRCVIDPSSLGSGRRFSGPRGTPIREILRLPCVAVKDAYAMRPGWQQRQTPGLGGGSYGSSRLLRRSYQGSVTEGRRRHLRLSSIGRLSPVLGLLWVIFGSFWGPLDATLNL